MTEHRTWNDGILTFQTLDKLIHILVRIKAKTMHTGIEFDMNGETGNAFFLRFFHQSIKQSERVNLGFEVIIEHRLKGGHLRIHNHDVAGDAVLAQRYTLISHCNSKIIHAMIL